MNNLSNENDEVVKLTKLFTLRDDGYSEYSLKFGSLSMESDNYITICSKLYSPTNSSPNESCALINLLNRTTQTLPVTKIDAAVAHPTEPFVAIRSDKYLQLYSLHHFQMVKSITLSEPIFYWRWVSDEELGIVTTTTVYHWTLHDSEPPRKKFLRSFESSFENAQIINYQVSPGGFWCLLIGLIFLPGQNEPSGVLQMYSVKKSASQNVRGRNGVFVTIQPQGYTSPIQVVCFEQKKSPEHPSQIFIVGRSNGDPDSTTNPSSAFRTTPRNIPSLPGISHDFPITMIASKCDDFVYLITRMGCFHLVDTHTGHTLYSQKLFDNNTLVFVSCLSGASGLLCVTRLLGEVFKIVVHHDKVFEYAMCRDDFTDYVPQLGERYRAMIERASDFPPSYDELPLSPDLAAVGQENHKREYNEYKYNEQKKPSSYERISKSNEDFYDPLEHGVSFPAVKGGMSSLSSSQMQHLAFGIGQNTPPPYPEMPSLQVSNEMTTPPQNWQRESSDPFSEIDLILQPPPQSNWAIWDTPASDNTTNNIAINTNNLSSTSTTQWDSWNSQPLQQLETPHRSVSPAPSSLSATSKVTEINSTLCDEGTLPSYMKQTPLQNISSSCEECSNLITQITTVLHNYEMLQKEFSTTKQQLEIYRGDTSLLLSLEDCDLFENEIYQLLFKLKEKKNELIKEKDNKEKELKMCVICQERERNIVFAPCGHLCVCTECYLTNNLTSCPLDRTWIDSTVTVYL